MTIWQRRLTPNLRCHLRIPLRNPDLRLFAPTKSASRRSTIRPDSRSDSKRDATPRPMRKWNWTHSTLPVILYFSNVCSGFGVDFLFWIITK